MKYILLIVAVLFSIPSPVSAQRDYFTPEEIELVRDAQEIDRRIEVLVKAIDRRFAAVKDGTASITAKENEKWGDISKLSRSEHLFDIKRILRKAIEDIDSLAERPESAYIEDPKDKKRSSYSDLFPKAVRHLAKAAERYQPILKGMMDLELSPVEKGSVMDALDDCQQILDAVVKLPAEIKKSKAKS